MPQAPLGTVVRQLRKTIDPAGVRDLADADLLQRFANERDEAAFAALMERHCRLVWSVCWNLLHHVQDVEDAFQATFLVLARQAGSIRHGRTVTSWLYRVAYRTALRARSDKTKRLANEREAATMPRDQPASELAWRELQTVLVEELDRLADKYRLPFLLCCVEGKSKSEAARELGWRDGTVSGRLALARKRMQERLARRGIALTAVLCALELMPRTSSAALSRGLLETTRKAALSFVGGPGSAALPERVAGLARGVLRTMAVSKMKSASLLLVVSGFVLGGAGFLGHQALADKSPAAEPPRAQLPATGSAERRKAAEMRGPVVAGEPRQAAEPVDTKDQVSLRGRVLDAAGKPLAGAPVAVVATLRTAGPLMNGGGPLTDSELLGQGKTDDRGRYHVRVARKLLERAHRVELLAGGTGHGVGRQEIKTGPRPADTDLRLERDDVLKGRLIDLDGQPAAGVKVSVVRLGKLSYPAGRQYTMNADAIEPAPIFYNDFDAPRPMMEKRAAAVTTHAVQFAAAPEGLPLWPKPAVTDAEGRFTIHGLAKGQVVGVQIRDERYAAVNLELAPPAQGDTAVLALGPPRTVEGTVTDAATGKSVAGARVHVDSFPDYFGGFGAVGEPADPKGRRHNFGNYYVSMGPQISRSDCQTDAHGHYRINPFQGNTLVVTISGPPGQPYLVLRKNLGWTEGALRQEWNAALPRGVEVRGRVEETGGKPVVGCRLDFWSKDFKSPGAFGDARQPRVLFPRQALTGTDGSFRAVLPPAKWHLLANAATGKFVEQKVVPEDITVVEIPKGAPPVQKVGDGQFHPDGYAAVEVKAGQELTGIKIVLRRAE